MKARWFSTTKHFQRCAAVAYESRVLVKHKQASVKTSDYLCNERTGIHNHTEFLFRHRLLVPYLVKLISLVGFPFSEALKIFIFITVLILNVLLFYLVMGMRIRPLESFLWVMLFICFIPGSKSKKLRRN